MRFIMRPEFDAATNTHTHTLQFKKRKERGCAMFTTPSPTTRSILDCPLFESKSAYTVDESQLLPAEECNKLLCSPRI